MKNNTDIRYNLERYKAGGSNRYVCPQCGGRKCFTRYIDLETEFIGGKPLLGLAQRRPTQVQVRPQEWHQTEFFDIKWAEKATLRTSTFRLWLEHLSEEGVIPNPLDSETIQRVIADYYVGGTANDVIVRGVNYGPAVVFWLIDEQGRVHDAKMMAYRQDGHRVSDWANSMRSICERKHIAPLLAETEKVLFGLHLLPRHPDETVCIVESEKTALLCACYYPQYLWLATGGCGNLQKEKLSPLASRRVVDYPDSGEYEKWSERMVSSGIARYKVLDFMEQYEPNTDIADILLGEARQKPEIFLPPPTEVCPF